MGLVTIDQIIKNLLMDPIYKWDRKNLYLAYAIRGIRQLQMHAATPKSVYLTLDSAKVAKLPTDFMRLSKLGVVNDRRIDVLTVDSNIVSAKEQKWTCEDGQVVPKPPSGDSTATWSFSNLDGIYPNDLGWENVCYGYGKGVNPAGVYNIDYQNRQIQFSSNVTGDSLVMEYISNGLEDDFNGDTYVDEMAFEALLAWIKWKVEEGRPPVRAKLADRAYWQRQWLRNKLTYTTTLFRITFDNLEWFADSAYSLSPKV